MAKGLPALNGPELLKLLVDNADWRIVGKTRHGVSIVRDSPEGRRVAVIPTKSSKSLPPPTLHGILGPKQTGLGRAGLARLLEIRVKPKRRRPSRR